MNPKSNHRKDTELPRFDLASIFDEVPKDQDLKIVELKRREPTLSEKIHRAANEGTGGVRPAIAA